MKVRLSRQRYGCQKCGHCCRQHNVLVFPEERSRLEKLEVPGVSRPYSETVGGQEVLRMHDDPAEGCIFLAADRTCLLHRSRGFAEKPLSCRAYPLSIHPTFEGEVGVMACFNCPGVMRQAGRLLEEQRDWIADATAALHPIGRGFTAEQRCHLQPSAILDVVRALQRILRIESGDFRLSLMACRRLADRVSALDAGLLNQAGLRREVLDGLVGNGGLFRAPESLSPPAGLQRMLFRTWLGVFCRREGEMSRRGIGFRLGQMAAMARFVCGRGSWRSLAAEHPDLPFRESGMLSGSPSPAWDPETWESCRRYLQARLEALHFFGEAYYGVRFWDGLQALLASALAVRAYARYHASARNAPEAGPRDVEKGVAAVDYCFGRSPLLGARMHRGTEKILAGEAFPSFLRFL